jgi:hypothetical protein
MKTHILVLAGLALVLGAQPAAATDPCIGDARAELGECKTVCKEDYQLAKDNCLNRDHACVEICRALREECRLATGIDDALTVCRDALRTAKGTCRSLHAEGSPELDQCIDQAQVIGFQCRRAARTTARPALNLCRDAFRTCAKACPPPDDPSEVIDPAQCKVDAKLAYRTCKEGCREALQFQKDVCLNRDHLCVEGCRSERDGCRQPIEDQLDTDVAACNAARDDTIATCGDDACIVNARVAAFQCRDQARETAKPNLEACRDAFRVCAEGCPPAS